MFFRRGTTGTDDPWLMEKMWIFTMGAVVALLGMLLDNGWIMTVGAVILGAGILLRFLPRPGADGREDEAGGAGGEDEGR